MASASRDNTVRLWDARSGQEQQTLEGQSSWVNAVAFPQGGLCPQSLPKTPKRQHPYGGETASPKKEREIALLKRRMAELSVRVAILVPESVELARGKLEHTSGERAARVLRSLPLLVVVWEALAKAGILEIDASGGISWAHLV